MDSRIDNDLAELKRSQAAELTKYNAELREVLCDQACKSELQIDATKAGIEELRSKIKEIVDYEKLSLQWLIKSIRSMWINYAGPGGINCQATVKDFFDKDTPQPPMHLKSDQAPISLQERHMASLGLAHLIPEVASAGWVRGGVPSRSYVRSAAEAFFGSAATKK